MGAWGVLAFDNDRANDWAYDLDDITDLSLVEDAIQRIEEIGEGYLDSYLACNALAACEVIARLRGNPGYRNAYTEKVDDWVAAHPQTPSRALVERATQVIARILGDHSELASRWGSQEEWRASVHDLRYRVANSSGAT